MYFKDETKNISRYQPITPDITGSDQACKGEEFTVCASGWICNGNGLNWDIPSTLVYLRDEGPDCIVLTPDPSVMDGEEATITTQAEINGGCVSTISSFNIPIFSSGTPPVPDGHIELEWVGEFDPCFDENEAIVNYVTDNPYKNGRTYNSRGILVLVPHHFEGGRVFITVCNYNPCSNEWACKTYTVFLPPPCGNDGPIHPLVIKKGTDEKGGLNNDELIFFKDNQNTFVPIIDFNIGIYPNPVRDVVTIEVLSIVKGIIKVMDIEGKIWSTIDISDQQRYQIDMSNYSLNGIYYLIIENQGTVISKNMIIKQ